MSEINGNAINLRPDEPATAWSEISKAAKPYVMAFALVTAAAAARVMLGWFDPNVLLFAIFYPVIIAIAFRYGTGPAVFATALSLFLAWYAVMPPQFELVWKARASSLNIALFCGSSGFLIWIADRYRRLVVAMDESERRRRLLVEELRHRSRNSMLVASTIISRTLRNDPATAEQLIARLNIVLASPDIYSETEEIECVLHRLLLAELKPYGTDRFALDGERMQILPRQARNLALIVHELATNSAKYGGLAAAEGFLFVSWRRDGSDIVLDWTEKGSKTAAADSNVKGFGTRLIETMVGDLKGRIEVKGNAWGYACRIIFPVNGSLPEVAVERPAGRSAFQVIDRACPQTRDS